MTSKKNINFILDEEESVSYNDTICILETIEAHAIQANDTKCAEQARKLLDGLEEFYAFYCDED